jgi:hypothetical protein
MAVDDNDRRYDERREEAGQAGPHAVLHGYWADQVMREGSFIQYAGYTINAPNHDGKVIVTKGGVNVMPAATWFPTMVDARAGIDVLEAVEGDGRRFRHLLRALQWAKGE